ncbi:hypothetical protein RKD49_005387 [Streptomyces glaucescens]
MSEPHDDVGVVTIGAREIYDQLVGLRDDVRSLVQSNADVQETLDDHEVRIRSVERWKYTVGTAALSAVVSAGVTISKAIGG